MAVASGTALLFPGQGSQAPGMRELVERVSPELLALARSEVGADPFERLEEGTGYAQPALYCASIASWIDAGRPDAEYVAGHSLGELAALAAAGAMEIDAGLRLAAVRGRAMQEAAERDPDGGGMVAILGDDAAAREIAARLGLVIANDNAPGQLVLSGPSSAVDAARPAAKQAGLKAIRLKVAGPFHSEAMTPALPAFRAELRRVAFSKPRMTVLSSITAEPFDDVAARLADALTLPVRWRESLLALREAGVRRFVETGPGKVLTGLVRRTLPDAEAISLSDPEPARA